MRYVSLAWIALGGLWAFLPGPDGPDYFWRWAFILMTIYLAPTIISALEDRRNFFVVFAVNLCAGWTGIGWMLAMSWALLDD